MSGRRPARRRHLGPGRPRAAGRLPRPSTEGDLAALLKSQPRLWALLRRHGIHVCAGCYLTLSSAPERAAAYHAVPDIPRFLGELRRLCPPPAGRGRR